MYGDVAGRVGRLAVQGYMAIEGCKHLMRPNAPLGPDLIRRYERTGLGFLLLNVVDELAVVVRGGGWDSHVHHILCAAAGALNLGIARRTDDTELQKEVLRIFMTLLANECVTPSFNAYALLARTGRGRGPGAMLAVASSIPMLKFRLVNTLSVLWRVHLGRRIGNTVEWRVFRASTTVFCLLLVALDCVWMRWAVAKLRVLARGRVR